MFCVNLEFKKIKVEQLFLRKENTNKKVVTDHLNEFLRINQMEKIFSKQSKITVINRIKLNLLQEKEIGSYFFHGREEFVREWPADLPAMTTLELSEMNVNQTLFKNMNNLNELRLRSYKKATLCQDPNLFSFLRNLRKLDIVGYEIDSLDSLIHSNLRVVNLCDNRLKLKKSTFQSLISLEELSLSSNSIEELDLDMFVCNKGLRILNLSHNKIVSLTNDINKSVVLSKGFFDNLSNLKILNLSNSDLMLKKSTFQGLISLEELNLSSNSIEELDPDMFICNKSLRILNLSSNKIVSFTNDVFKNVRKRKVEKERNNSRRLAPTIFQSLVDLKELNLSYNRILDLDSDIFSCNKNLIKLNISSNGLNELKKGLFRNLFSLEDLNLCCNSIMHLTECSFQNLMNLKRLSLSNNHITDLPVKLFCGLVCLESVDLTLNRCLGKSRKDLDVERLDIDKNKIKVVVHNNNNVSYSWSRSRSRQCRRRILPE